LARFIEVSCPIQLVVRARSGEDLALSKFVQQHVLGMRDDDLAGRADTRGEHPAQQPHAELFD